MIVYQVVILHHMAPPEPLPELFSSEGLAHASYRLSYSNVGQSDKPLYEVKALHVYDEVTHL